MRELAPAHPVGGGGEDDGGVFQDPQAAAILAGGTALDMGLALLGEAEAGDSVPVKDDRLRKLRRLRFRGNFRGGGSRDLGLRGGGEGIRGDLRGGGIDHFILLIHSGTPFGCDVPSGLQALWEAEKKCGMAL